MFPVTAVDAKKDLPLAGESVNTSTSRACLGRVRGRDFSKYTPGPRELVGEKFSEQAPTLIEDASCKTSVRFDHVADLEILDHDGAVALGVVVTELVTEVLPLPPNLSMQVGDTKLCFLSVLGSFLPPRDGTLSAGEPLESLAVEARRGDDLSIGVSDHVRDASVDSDDRVGPEGWIRDLDLTLDRDEPLIAVSLERASLGNSFDGSVDNGHEVAKLWEADRRSIEAPSFRVRLGQAEEVSASLLPPRRHRELLEASLPRHIEFNEELGTDVAGNIGEPWQLSSKFGQLLDLVERCGVDTLAFGAGVAHLPLLKSEVPEPAKSTFPFSVPLNLSERRIDAVTERLARDHGEKYAVGLRCRQATFARVDTLYTTSTLTWSSFRSTAARSLRLGSSKLSEGAGVRSAATSRARWLNRTSNPTTFTSWSSTRRRLHSPFSSTPSKASRLDGSA